MDAASGNRRKTRRTQAERSAATREKVIQAAIDCILEEGVQNATAARIAKRSGMTWGAIAHQFGNKDAVFMAVVQRNLEIMSQSLSDLSVTALAPRERISLLIDRSWEHCNHPSSRAYSQLILYGYNNPGEKIRKQQEQLTALLTKEIWDNFFADLGVDSTVLETARNLSYATMLGMTIQGMVGRRKPQFRRELAALKNIIPVLLDLRAD